MTNSPNRCAMACARHAAERAAAMVHLELSRGTTSLVAIGRTARLLGLFGSVMALLEALGPTGRPILTDCCCAGGISETLIAFAIGLPTAILALSVFHHLKRQVERFDFEMRVATLNLLDQLAPLRLRRQD